MAEANPVGNALRGAFAAKNPANSRSSMNALTGAASIAFTTSLRTSLSAAVVGNMSDLKAVPSLFIDAKTTEIPFMQLKDALGRIEDASVDTVSFIYFGVIWSYPSRSTVRP